MLITHAIHLDVGDVVTYVILDFDSTIFFLNLALILIVNKTIACFTLHKID